MLPDGIVPFLIEQTAIARTVGSRVQPIPASEDLSQYPLITYQSPSDVPLDFNMDGPSGVSQMRIIFDCRALRYLDARNLARTLKGILQGFTGILPDGTRIYNCEVVAVVDGFDDGSRVYSVKVHGMFQYAD